MLAIDLLRRAIFLDHLQEVVDHALVGVEQDGVDSIQAVRGDFEQIVQVLIHSCLRLRLV